MTTDTTWLCRTHSETDTTETCACFGAATSYPEDLTLTTLINTLNHFTRFVNTASRQRQWLLDRQAHLRTLKQTRPVRRQVRHLSKLIKRRRQIADLLIAEVEHLGEDQAPPSLHYLISLGEIEAPNPHPAPRPPTPKPIVYTATLHGPSTFNLTLPDFDPPS